MGNRRSRPFISRICRSGGRFKTIGRTVTEADITNSLSTAPAWSRCCYTNTEFLAHESDIKGRPAPGALVYCFAEGLLVQSTMQHTGFAFLHMELSVESPVVAGDTIHAECEIIEARPLEEPGPAAACVRTRVRVVKQDGTAALTYTAAAHGEDAGATMNLLDITSSSRGRPGSTSFSRPVVHGLRRDDDGGSGQPHRARRLASLKLKAASHTAILPSRVTQISTPRAGHLLCRHDGPAIRLPSNWRVMSPDSARNSFSQAVDPICRSLRLRNSFSSSALPRNSGQVAKADRRNHR